MCPCKCVLVPHSPSSSQQGELTLSTLVKSELFFLSLQARWTSLHLCSFLFSPRSLQIERSQSHTSALSLVCGPSEWSAFMWINYGTSQPIKCHSKTGYGYGWALSLGFSRRRRTKSKQCITGRLFVDLQKPSLLRSSDRRMIWWIVDIFAIQQTLLHPPTHGISSLCHL